MSAWFYIILILLAAGLIAYFIWKQDPTLDSLINSPPINAKVGTSTVLQACLGDEGRIELPLTYDNANGVYRSRIRLGDSNKSVMFLPT